MTSEMNSVQFSRSVVSNSLWPHESQHTRPPCPSPTPVEPTQTHVHWVGDAIQPSYSLLSPSLPAFNLSQHQDLFQWVFFTSGGQSIKASASVLSMNIQDCTFLGLAKPVMSFIHHNHRRVFMVLDMLCSACSSFPSPPPSTPSPANTDLLLSSQCCLFQNVM